MKYILSCPKCQRDMPVESGQAGQMLHCACGQQVEVPTIRQLRQLRPADDEPAAVSRWNRRHGYRFVGGVITAVALVLAGYVWLAWPVLYDEGAIVREIQSQAPFVSFLRLQSLEPPLPTPASERVESAPQLAPSKKLLQQVEGAGPQNVAPQQAYISYEHLRTRRTLGQFLPFAGILAAVGALTLAMSFLAPGKRSERRSTNRPRKQRESPVAQRSGRSE
jgi:hypothetical protein